jgi:uncharacterized protein
VRGRPVALITGASSGIGEALADQLARSGYDLVLLARRRDRLEDTAARLRKEGAEVEVLVADLSDDSGLERAIARAAAGDIDLLVNNAGASAYASLGTFSPSETRQLWTLNATAPMLLSRAVLPGLLERGTGGMITVASLLAFSAGQSATYLPPRTIYVAAKAAAVAFCRTLASELVGTGVRVTLVLPGRVKTEFSRGAAQSDPQAMTAQDVATATWQAYAAGETICVPALEDVSTAFAELTTAETSLLRDGNKAELAPRYSA